MPNPSLKPGCRRRGRPSPLAASPTSGWPPRPRCCASCAKRCRRWPPERAGCASLDLSLAAEGEHFRAAAELRGADDKGGARPTRAAAIARLHAGADAAYGSGLIGARERAELDKAFARLAGDEVMLGEHLAALRSLGLVPGWGSQTLRQHFGEAMDKLAAIEPLADLFIQDQLRGSPLLAYSRASMRCCAMPTVPPACSTGCWAARSAPASAR